MKLVPCVALISTTMRARPCCRSLDAMRPYFAEHFGNASSIHHHGQETRAAVERARESVADLLAARLRNCLTSGGTKRHFAIFGLAKPGDISSLDHRASRVMNACKHSKRRDAKSPAFPSTAAAHRSDDVKRASVQDKLITIMTANNETASCSPSKRSARSREADVYFHTDAVQAVANPIDVNKIACDS